MSRFSNKRVVITGAAGGVGEVASHLFCAEGGSVLGVDLAQEAGAKLEEQLRSEGFDFTFKAADVTSSEQVGDLVNFAAETWGNVDALCNNAGVILGKPLVESTDEDWDRILDIDLKSVFLMTRGFIPLMESSQGSIVNTSSIGADIAFKGMTVYAAAKAGVIGFSKACAAEFAPAVRVNAILPGVIDTPMPRNFIKDLEDPDAIFRGFEEGHLVGRLGRPEEIAKLIAFLASDESSFITGTGLVADGGWSTV